MPHIRRTAWRMCINKRCEQGACTLVALCLVLGVPVWASACMQPVLLQTGS